MSLIQSFLKILLSKNYVKYLLVVLSIILSYALIAVTTAYVDTILSLTTESEYSMMRNLIISILTIFLIAGVSLIIYQYFNIMKSGMRDYYILEGLDATKRNIRMLIFVQVIILIIISLPIGLLCGYLLTEDLFNLIGGIQGNQYIWGISSNTILFLVSGIIGSLIILIGIYLDRGVRKMPLDSILSDNFLVGKEV